MLHSAGRAEGDGAASTELRRKLAALRAVERRRLGSLGPRAAPGVHDDRLCRRWLAPPACACVPRDARRGRRRVRRPRCLRPRPSDDAHSRIEPVTTRPRGPRRWWTRCTASQVADPYRWLEDEKAPEVQAWMKAQDAFTRERLAKMPGRDALARRFTELFYVESVSAPARARRAATSTSARHKDKEKADPLLARGREGRGAGAARPQHLERGRHRVAGRVGALVGRQEGGLRRRSPTPRTRRSSTCWTWTRASGREVDVIEGAKYACPELDAGQQGLLLRVAADGPDHPRGRAARLHRAAPARAGHGPEEGRRGAPAHRRPEDVPRAAASAGTASTSSSTSSAAGARTTSTGSGVGGEGLPPAGEGQGRASTRSTSGRTASTSSPTRARPGSASSRSSRTKPERAAWKEIVPEDPAAALQSRQHRRRAPGARRT